MLWLCIHLPALPLEALAPPAHEPAAVAEQRGTRRLVIAVNAAAAARGVQAGSPANAALGLIPDLRLLPRDLAAERQVLESLACWAYSLGTPVTLGAATFDVWVEVERSLLLFRGWNGLRRHIALRARELEQTVQLGLAPTLGAAALLAHADAGLGRAIARLGEIHAAIRDWPLQLLPLEAEALHVLQASGLRRIGEVLALPQDALGRRFGPQAGLAILRLLGRAGEAWQTFEPPPVYRRRLELNGGAESTEALLFPLRKMLGDFALYLRGRDAAVQRFRLHCRDLGRRGFNLDIGLMAPTRDPNRLLLVLREKLEKIALGEPVHELRLEARRFEPASAAQDDLFQAGSAIAEGFDSLRERLAARLGSTAVRSLAPAPDHRPERSWTLSPGPHPTTGSASGRQPEAAASMHAPRPPWLLPLAKPIPPPRLLGPAERIECGWWDGGGQCRDYHLAEDEQGRRLWVYHEPGGEQWKLHGLWQ